MNASPCEICGEPFVYPGYVGKATCHGCGAVWEYDEGACIVLDDEMKAALLEVLRGRQKVDAGKSVSPS